MSFAGGDVNFAVWAVDVLSFGGRENAATGTRACEFKSGTDENLSGYQDEKYY